MVIFDVPLIDHQLIKQQRFLTKQPDIQTAFFLHPQYQLKFSTSLPNDTDIHTFDYNAKIRSFALALLRV